VRFRELAALLIVAFLVAMSPTRASAQLAPFTVPLWTNAIYGGLATNSANSGFQIIPGKSYTFVLAYKNHVATGTNGPVTLYMNGSITGTNWTTTFPISLTASTHLGGAGTNREVFTLPATNGALIKQFSFLRVDKFSSINTNVITNVVMIARPYDY
jgi:hypothetical protein